MLTRPTRALVSAATIFIVMTVSIGSGILVAGAVVTGGGSPFAIAPAPTPAGVVRGYFNLSTSAGSSTKDTVIVSNLSKHVEQLKIGAASGTTAPNSGSAYVGAFSSCQQSACWISGLPTQLTLAGGASKSIRFTVTVPGQTPSGQYLAGISVELANPPAPVSVGSNGRSQAQAIVINEATVGLAFTVGSLASLTSRLVIIGVVGSTFSGVPRLIVTVKNIGTTFARGAGQAICVVKNRTLSFPTYVNTVLPGDTAEVTINAIGITAGDLSECNIDIPYSQSGSAHWNGSVIIPVTQAETHYHPKPGVYVNVPVNKLALWVKVLVGAVAVLVLMTGVLVGVLVRNRRRLRI